MHHLVINWMSNWFNLSSFPARADLKMDRDEVLVKIVEHECIIWKRNHPQFKNVTMKEQAWQRVAYQLGISSESVLQTPHTHSRATANQVSLFLLHRIHLRPSSFPQKMKQSTKISVLIQLPNQHICTFRWAVFRPSFEWYRRCEMK